MDTRLSFLIKWPDRESLQRTMPFCFRCNYGLKHIYYWLLQNIYCEALKSACRQELYMVTVQAL